MANCVGFDEIFDVLFGCSCPACPTMFEPPSPLREQITVAFLSPLSPTCRTQRTTEPRDCLNMDITDFKRTLGRLIYDLRREQALSQERLALEAAVDRTWMGKSNAARPIRPSIR